MKEKRLTGDVPAGRSSDFAVLDGTDSDTYLGSPHVVQFLVNGYCEQVYEWIKERGKGRMSKDEFSAKLREFIGVFADIFMGRNANYVSVVGWNNPFGLGLALKQSMGAFWERHKADYDNDPGKAAFGWLAASLVESSLNALKDPDQSGAAIKAKKDQMVRVLLGAHGRR